MFTSLIIPAQDFRCPEPLPQLGVRWAPTWDGMPLNHSTHAHSDWDHVDMTVDLTGTALGHGRKCHVTKHADMGRTCRLHRPWPWPGIDFCVFFSSSTLQWNDGIRGLAVVALAAVVTPPAAVTSSYDGDHATRLTRMHLLRSDLTESVFPQMRAESLFKWSKCSKLMSHVI